MIRKIKLHGSLVQAGVSEYSLDVNTQQELFAALRANSKPLDMALRKAGKVCLVATDEAGKEAVGIQEGFQFGDEVTNIHIAPPTEGAWMYVAVAVIAAVAVSYMTPRPSMQTGPNGASGPKTTMFNGPVNSTDQGGAIPIIYGKKCLVGSTIISADEDYFNIA